MSTEHVDAQITGFCATPSHQEIVGRYVKLVPLKAVHAEQLYACVGGQRLAHLFDYMPNGPFFDLDSLRADLQKKETSVDPLFFAVSDLRVDSIAGYCAFLRIDTNNRVIEIGHLLFGPSLQRTTAATELIYLLACKAFDLGFRRLEWKCNANNQASRKAAVRYGFTFEGIFRQHMIVKGQNRDTAWYSIIDREWPELRAVFERWMQADNFDAEGKQKQTLASMRQATTNS